MSFACSISENRDIYSPWTPTLLYLKLISNQINLFSITVVICFYDFFLFYLISPSHVQLDYIEGLGGTSDQTTPELPRDGDPSDQQAEERRLRRGLLHGQQHCRKL